MCIGLVYKNSTNMREPQWTVCCANGKSGNLVYSAKKKKKCIHKLEPANVCITPSTARVVNFVFRYSFEVR